MSDCEVISPHFKTIGIEEDTFKSLMAFDVTPCMPIFKAVVLPLP